MSYINKNFEYTHTLQWRCQCHPSPTPTPHTTYTHRQVTVQRSVKVKGPYENNNVLCEYTNVNFLHIHTGKSRSRTTMLRAETPRTKRSRCPFSTCKTT
jgi:hypothetical protein